MHTLALQGELFLCNKKRKMLNRNRKVKKILASEGVYFFRTQSIQTFCEKAAGLSRRLSLSGEALCLFKHHIKKTVPHKAQQCRACDDDAENGHN